jgi:hypothetical protein
LQGSAILVDRSVILNVKRTAYRPQRINISTAIAAFVRHDAPKLHRKKMETFRRGASTIAKGAECLSSM